LDKNPGAKGVDLMQVNVKDFLSTKPGSLAGRYLRMFWQPVYCSHELRSGKAVPITIMGEQFTLYRGESGDAHLIGFRCAHRGTQLSVGWVEGDCVRCCFHGWMYDGAGQCVDQPAEPQPFCSKVRVPGFPVRERMGLIFVYLGEGDPPSFPTYPMFEEPDSVVDAQAHYRPYNYFQDVENSVDQTHVLFTHRRHHRQARDEAQDKAGHPALAFEENSWGISVVVTYSNGLKNYIYSGMPNINFVYGQIVDPEVKRSLNITYKVPIDDEKHIFFIVHKLPVKGDTAKRILERRRATWVAERSSTGAIITDVIGGIMGFDEVNSKRIDFVSIEDGVVQGAQGVVCDRDSERLGRGDEGVILLRKIWRRELQALAEGKPLKEWRYQPGMVPRWENM
jgi:5,5'-dehydrodivanillate O-demethylase